MVEQRSVASLTRVRFPLVAPVKTATAFYYITSLLLQVPVLAFALIIILLWFGVLSLQDYGWVIVMFLHLSLLPLLYGAFVYKTRRISNADITQRKERIIPFFVITFIYGGFLLISTLFNAPEIFTTVSVYFFTLALLLSVITIFWKISVHSAGITQFVILLLLLIGSQALVLLPLILFTGWLRIRMKSHDFWQVLGGIAVALASAFVATQITPL